MERRLISLLKGIVERDGAGELDKGKFMDHNKELFLKKKIWRLLEN